MKKCIKTIREYSQQIIRDRRAVDTSMKSDLLSRFMDLKDSDGNDLYTDENLQDMVLNFLIAGRDTTAQALSWTFYLLHLNPRVLNVLLKEIDEVLGDKLIPTYDQCKTMKYANAVFHETLRLYPSVPKNAKEALNDDVLPNGTVIKKGTLKLI